MVMDKLPRKMKQAGQFILDLFFKPAETSLAKWFTAALLAGLFVAGIVHWGYFLNWFRNNFVIGDWHLIVDPMLKFLSNAMRSGQLPLHGSSHFLIPDRYLARPNRPLSPQVLLLYLFDPATYVMVNTWIFFSIGFIGLLLIRKKYQLSLVSFTALFLLFNFNGHITSHLAVGHVEWVGYFLLPFFVLLVLQMVEGGKTGWGWVLGLALTMLGINLQGAYHFFLYCMVFLLLLALFQPRFWAPVIKAIIACGLISMVRLLPPAVQYYSASKITFIYGFLSVAQLIQTIIVLQHPYILDTPNGQIGGWEVDYYLGLIGFTFMIYFGVVKAWINERNQRSLYFPMLVMTFFSMGSIYYPLFSSHIPFMDSQRAPSRFILIPFVFLIILASIQFQKWTKGWNEDAWMEKIFALLGLVFIGYDLLEHSLYWRLSQLSADIIQRYSNIVQVYVSNHADPPYITAIIAGLAVSLATLIILIILTSRESKNNRIESHPS
jgi:hypothetical protein